MPYQIALFRLLKKYFSSSSVVSISGASGTGKSTLAQHIVGASLTEESPYEDCCLWIQASETFSKKRLSKLFGTYPEKLAYLDKNVFITPKSRTCRSYLEQSECIGKLVEEGAILPPNLKYVIIDNVSHHLRYEASQINDISRKVFVMNDFFNSQLFPLIMLCQREAISLVLIHEVSYDPKLAKTAKFFHKLYDRIDSLEVMLSKNSRTRQRVMEIKSNGVIRVFNYELTDTGVFFL